MTRRWILGGGMISRPSSRHLPGTSGASCSRSSAHRRVISPFLRVGRRSGILERMRCLWRLLLLAACAASSAVAAGECRVPLPDGGEKRPTAANLTGRVARVEGRDVVIRQAGRDKLVKVRVPEAAKTYTAFGNAAALAELGKEQTVWVWFQKCRWPKKGTPVSAYFQTYASAPTSQQ